MTGNKTSNVKEKKSQIVDNETWYRCSKCKQVIHGNDMAVGGLGFPFDICKECSPFYWCNGTHGEDIEWDNKEVHNKECKVCNNGK